MWFKIKELAKTKKEILIITLISAAKKNAGLIGESCLVYDSEIIENNSLENIGFRKHWQSLKEQQDFPFKNEIEDENGIWVYFVEKHNYKRKALILGAGHVGKSLCPILNFIGFEVTVVDDRPDFLKCIEKANKVINLPFAKLFEIDCNYDATVIVTRGHRHDLVAIREILKQFKFGNYLGMIGSRKRSMEMLKILASEGVSEEYIKEINSPIGLNIGAETPEEIAISISAEIIKFFNVTEKK